MTRILILKTGALGDVLRTTSILPGLRERFPSMEVTWVTAPAARTLVERHPEVGRVLEVAPDDEAAVARLSEQLAQERFEWVLSLDDEWPLCRMAAAQDTVRLSGATIVDGERSYTDDVREWFDMGLLSRLGKVEADALKVQNHRSHPQIYADMFGIAPGQPALPLQAREVEGAQDFFRLSKLGTRGPVIGLNTGAGGRWSSKTMPLAEVVRLIESLHRSMAGQVHFLLLGGPSEADRNQTIALHASNLADPPHVVDGGSENSLGEFAALIDRLDLLITSDSLALHLAVARHRPIVSFFAPTSAAEIELYGLGEKVLSTARDYCSYRKDADNSTITAERVGESALRVLGTKVT